MQGKVNIICGATATGKSSLAISKALINNGIIINADSQQVYKELPILSSCPSVEEYNMVPHKLYEFIDGNDRMDASKWLAFAVEEIKKAFAEGKTLYLVGGTGFYIKALTEGLSVVPNIPEKIRGLVRKEGINAKLSDLYEILKGYDPELAEKVGKNNKQRILRGIEVFRATGVPLSHWQRQKKVKPIGSEVVFDIEQLDFEMKELEARIAIRTDKILGMGVIEEVEALYQKDYYLDAPIFKVIGVEAIKKHIDGELGKSELRDNIILLTRQYAKRQRTFFRTQIDLLKK